MSAKGTVYEQFYIRWTVHELYERSISDKGTARSSVFLPFLCYSLTFPFLPSIIILCQIQSAMFHSIRSNHWPKPTKFSGQIFALVTCDTSSLSDPGKSSFSRQLIFRFWKPIFLLNILFHIFRRLPLPLFSYYSLTLSLSLYLTLPAMFLQLINEEIRGLESFTIDLVRVGVHHFSRIQTKL